MKLQQVFEICEAYAEFRNAEKMICEVNGNE